MLIKHLEYLAALAHERHFARAAAACRVTQPTLSAGLKQLEDSMGVLLVERGQRFQGLTAEGERVLVWARRILADCESLAQDVGAMHGDLVGRLRIGAVPMALPAISLLTSRFAARHPRVTVSVLSHTSAEILRGLEDFSLDVGITYLDGEPLPHLRTMPLYQERYLLLTPADGPFGGREWVTWREAASVPLCLLTPDMQNRRIIGGLLGQAGVAVAPRIETNSTIVLVAHVLSGGCATILPLGAAEIFLHHGPLRAVPLDDPDARHRVGLIVPAREPQTPLVAALLAEARRQA